MKHRATDSLSEQATAIMRRGFGANKSSAAIAREIEQATGERVNVRTVGRRGFEWRELMARRERALEEAKAYIDAAKAGDINAADMISALATEALVDDASGYAHLDPLKVQSQNLRAEEIRLKRDALRLKEREIAVGEARLKILQDRESRTVAALTETGTPLTPDQRVEVIRGIYGLSTPAVEAAPQG